VRAILFPLSPMTSHSPTPSKECAMKRLPIALLLSILSGPTISALAAEPAKLSFDTYSGYFVSNKFEPDAPRSFAIITDRPQFEDIFGVARVMGDKSHRLPKNAFASKMVVAAIRRGNAVWDFKVDDVTVADGVVQIHYACKASKSETATFACPLIVSIPKGPYKAVEFLENKKLAKKIELGH
jgi:hypothetical protein